MKECGLVLGRNNEEVEEQLTEEEERRTGSIKSRKKDEQARISAKSILVRKCEVNTVSISRTVSTT